MAKQAVRQARLTPDDEPEQAAIEAGLKVATAVVNEAAVASETGLGLEAQGAPVAARVTLPPPVAEAMVLAVPEIVISRVSVEVPMLAVGAPMEGYHASIREMKVELSDPRLASKFRRVLSALYQSRATYQQPGGRPPKVVETGADAFRWLVDQLPDA